MSFTLDSAEDGNNGLADELFRLVELADTSALITGRWAELLKLETVMFILVMVMHSSVRIVNELL